MAAAVTVMLISGKVTRWRVHGSETIITCCQKQCANVDKGQSDCCTEARMFLLIRWSVGCFEWVSVCRWLTMELWHAVGWLSLQCDYSRLLAARL